MGLRLAGEVLAVSMRRCTAYDDPTLNIPWPLKDVKLSEKDRNGTSMKAILTELK